MIESTFVEIINKNEKNMVAGYIYKHPKQTIPDLLDNQLLPLLEKLSNKNKQIIISTSIFLTVMTKIRQIFSIQCFPILIYLLSTHPLEWQVI